MRGAKSFLLNPTPLSLGIRPAADQRFVGRDRPTRCRGRPRASGWDRAPSAGPDRRSASTSASGRGCRGELVLEARHLDELAALPRVRGAEQKSRQAIPVVLERGVPSWNPTVASSAPGSGRSRLDRMECPARTFAELGCQCFIGGGGSRSRTGCRAHPSSSSRSC